MITFSKVLCLCWWYWYRLTNFLLGNFARITRKLNPTGLLFSLLTFWFPYLLITLPFGFGAVNGRGCYPLWCVRDSCCVDVNGQSVQRIRSLWKFTRRASATDMYICYANVLSPTYIYLEISVYVCMCMWMFRWKKCDICNLFQKVEMTRMIDE